LSQRVRYALRVTATSEEGAESTASFSGSDEDADLNELPLWRSRPEATEQDAALSLRHPPLTVRGELESEPYVGWQALSGGRPFWEEPFVVTGATWPDRLLEDFDEPRVRVALRSRSFPPDGEVDLTDAIPYDMEAYTPSAAVASRTRVPASRGGRCPAVRPDGLCPFTDGALEPVSFAAPGPLAPSTTEVIVELPRPVAARHLILRNMFAAGIYGVEVAGAQSAESPWQLLASRAVELPPRNTFFMDGPSLYLDLPLDGEVGPVSRIRLKINGDGVTPTLAELSIFE
ncbi:MAG TPA: hypothetical protein VEY30_05070, partial [Myxococcaceae bacterium]|nr:hypothetical protein [Myxococcaceae bacterium]